jgi:hypothetical protein
LALNERILKRWDLQRLPELLDDTDQRPAAVQLGDHWQPIKTTWRLEGSGLSNATYYGAGAVHALLGAIRLPNELVMLFENQLVAIVQPSRAFEVSQIMFEVHWIELSKNTPWPSDDEVVDDEENAIEVRARPE